MNNINVFFHYLLIHQQEQLSLYVIVVVIFLFMKIRMRYLRVLFDQQLNKQNYLQLNVFVNIFYKLVNKSKFIIKFRNKFFVVR
jgi:hypothetical protein